MKVIEKSLPSRERGLKSEAGQHINYVTIVAPFAGAWIEMFEFQFLINVLQCRSLRGSVD